MQTVQLTSGQADHLARGIVRMQNEIAAWMESPAVQAEYEEWLAAQGDRIARRARLQEEYRLKREAATRQPAAAKPVSVPA